MNQVEWHTRKKPPEDGFYLVTLPSGLVRMGRYYKVYDIWDCKKRILAWAHLPEGYKGVKA